MNLDNIFSKAKEVFESAYKKTGNIARADSCRQSRGHGLERSHLACTRLLLLEDLANGILHGVAELAELQESGAYTEVNTGAHQQDQHPGTPGNTIQKAYDFV